MNSRISVIVAVVLVLTGVSVYFYITSAPETTVGKDVLLRDAMMEDEMHMIEEEMETANGGVSK